MWTHKNTFAIGGLEEVGFAENQDLLLLLSSQGEGIFDTLKGEKVARRNNHYDWWNRYDKVKKIIKGFDVLVDFEIQVSGLIDGDQLPKSTDDGWKLISDESEMDFESKVIFLVSPDNDRFLIGGEDFFELRAFGFSPTHKSLVIALSGEIIFFSRE